MRFGAPVSHQKRVWLVATGVISLTGFLVQLLTRRTNLIDLHAFRQTQTAFTIREYMSGNWSLDTPLPVLGPPWSVPYEFPLFQGIAALLGNAVGITADTAGRMVGLAFFVLTGILLAVLVRRWFGVRASLTTLVLYQATPFAAQWASASLIEFAATALLLGSIVAIDSYAKKSTWVWLSLATVLLSLGFMVKVTTAVAWAGVFFVAAVGLSWRKIPHGRSLFIGIGPLVIALGAGIAWARYADSVKEANPIGVYLTSGALREWNFGTVGQRLSFEQWDSIFARLPTLGAPLWLFLILLTVALWRLKLDPHLVALATVPLIGVLIFFNLYVVHSYYLSAVYPAYVAVIAIGVTSLSRFVRRQSFSIILAGAISALLISLSWISVEGREIARLIGVEGELPQISRVIAASTPPEAGVIVVGCDWDPTPLFYAERRGMMLPSWYRDGIPPEWIGTDLKYLVFCTPDYRVGEGNPRAVLPDGTLFTEIEPGIFIIGAPAPWFERTYVQ